MLTVSAIRVFVAVVFSARAIQLSRPKTNYRSRCDEVELQRTHRLLRSRQYNDLPLTPCIPATTLNAIQNGLEDADDAWEFFGCMSPPDPKLDNMPQFEHPGPCGAQLPKTSCTKTQLPSILYLGMPHSGSSGLAWQMNSHPNLSYGITKEHSFFTTGGPTWKTPYGADECCEAQQLCDCRNTSTYESEFEVDCDVQYTFDATPSSIYLGYGNDLCTSDQEHNVQVRNCPINYHWRRPGKEALEDVRKLLGPDIKLIMMLRDPLDYIESLTGRDGLKPTLKAMEYGVLLCYADYLEGWLSVFPRENFLFLTSDDYFEDPQNVLDKVFDFLSVSKRKYTQNELQSLGRRRNTYHPLTDDIRKDYWQEARNIDCKARLETMTGLQFNWKGHE